MAGNVLKSISASGVYEGVVRHRRRHPHAHAFRYRIALLYLDLDEIERVFEGHWFWSVGRGNLAQFRRSDYLGPADVPLSQAVRRRAEPILGRPVAGPIRMLTHLRYFGHVFNPVTFYYCFEADGSTLACVLAEITNTPWKERHSYVLPVDRSRRNGRMLQWDFDKRFHVSPFMAMDCNYRWRLAVPDQSLHVHMDVVRHGQLQFDATLALRRHPIGAATLARVLWRYPLMTLRVVGAIHWQALLLWLKHTPVFPHPRSGCP